MEANATRPLIQCRAGSRPSVSGPRPPFAPHFGRSLIFNELLGSDQPHGCTPVFLPSRLGLGRVAANAWCSSSPCPGARGGRPLCSPLILCPSSLLRPEGPRVWCPHATMQTVQQQVRGAAPAEWRSAGSCPTHLSHSSAPGRTAQSDPPLATVSPFFGRSRLYLDAPNPARSGPDVGRPSSILLPRRLSPGRRRVAPPAAHRLFPPSSVRMPSLAHR